MTVRDAPDESRGPGDRPVPGPAQRMEWMDLTRGSAIVLVVLFHAIGFPSWYYDIDMPDWLWRIDGFFLPFRMPTLLMLSGMLLSRALAKPVATYYLGKARTLVWPVIVWAGVEVLTYSYTGGQGATVLEPTRWLEFPTYLWFIVFLAGYFALGPAVNWVPAWVCAVAAWAGAFLTGGTVATFLYFGGFFFAGCAYVDHRRTVDRLMRGPVRAVLALLAIGLGLAASSGQVEVFGRVELVPLNLAGILTAVWVARSVPAGSAGWLQLVGRNSIVFYLVHYPLQLMLLFAMITLGVVLPGPAWVVIETAAALAVGTALTRARSRPLVGWLFEWPRRRPVPSAVS